MSSLSVCDNIVTMTNATHVKCVLQRKFEEYYLPYALQDNTFILFQGINGMIQEHCVFFARMRQTNIDEARFNMLVLCTSFMIGGWMV
jgi:hypothetical protein